MHYKYEYEVTDEVANIINKKLINLFITTGGLK